MPAEAPKTGGFSFGAPTAAASNEEKKTDKPAEAPKPGGFSFGNIGTSATTASGDDKGKAPEAPKAGGFSFGGLGAKTDGDKDKAPAAPTPAAPAAGGLFGAKPADAGQSSTAAPSASGGLFGANPNTTAAASTTTPAVPTAPIASAPANVEKPSEPVPNLLRGKALDDIVEGWNKDLEEQVKEFERQAGEVREWDKILVRNGNQVGGNLVRVLDTS